MPSDYIDYKVKVLVEDFLEEEIYPSIIDKDNLLGVLIYGSSLTGFASTNSDIDILILVNEADCSTRGVKIFGGHKMEYFIKPIEKFLSEAVSFTKKNCPSHVALEQNAYILYDRYDFVKNILLADKDFYNKNREKPNINFVLKYVQIENRIASLKNILERNGKEFYMVYYNILEMIRNFHSMFHGEAEIPFAKAYRIYNDMDYYDKFVSLNSSNPLPNDDFVRLYSKCVEFRDNKDEMLNNLVELFGLEQKNIKINPNNYILNF